MTINWPEQLGERTPPERRESTRKFDLSYNRTVSELSDVLDGRMDVEMWGMDEDKSRGGDPAIVIRWKKDNQDFAIACDKYTSKRDNARECLKWLQETVRRRDRPVVHGEDDFAAARLPPGDPEREMVVGRQPAHEVLGVQPDADPDAVEAAAKRLQKKYHPDTGEEPDRQKFTRVTKARKEMKAK